AHWSDFVHKPKAISPALRDPGRWRVDGIKTSREATTGVSKVVQLQTKAGEARTNCEVKQQEAHQPCALPQ
ncbi:unnamed protein product, partial [Staurois parvus]